MEEPSVDPAGNKLFNSNQVGTLPEQSTFWSVEDGAKSEY